MGRGAEPNVGRRSGLVSIVFGNPGVRLNCTLTYTNNVDMENMKIVFCLFYFLGD